MFGISSVLIRNKKNSQGALPSSSLNRKQGHRGGRCTQSTATPAASQSKTSDPRLVAGLAIETTTSTFYAVRLTAPRRKQQQRQMNNPKAFASTYKSCTTIFRRKPQQHSNGKQNARQHLGVDYREYDSISSKKRAPLLYLLFLLLCPQT